MSNKLKEIDACILILHKQRDVMVEAIRRDEISLLAARSLNLDGSSEHAFIAEMSLRHYLSELVGFHCDEVAKLDETIDKLRDLYREEYANASK